MVNYSVEKEKKTKYMRLYQCIVMCSYSFGFLFIPKRNCVMCDHIYLANQKCVTNENCQVNRLTSDEEVECV